MSSWADGAVFPIVLNQEDYNSGLNYRAYLIGQAIQTTPPDWFEPKFEPKPEEPKEPAKAIVFLKTHYPEFVGALENINLNNFSLLNLSVMSIESAADETILIEDVYYASSWDPVWPHDKIPSSLLITIAKQYKAGWDGYIKAKASFLPALDSWRKGYAEAKTTQWPIYYADQVIALLDDE